MNVSVKEKYDVEVKVKSVCGKVVANIKPSPKAVAVPVNSPVSSRSGGTPPPPPPRNARRLETISSTSSTPSPAPPVPFRNIPTVSVAEEIAPRKSKRRVSRTTAR